MGGGRRGVACRECGGVEYWGEAAQHENDMMDDSNWLDPMTRAEFTAALDKHPIGRPLPNVPGPPSSAPAPTCICPAPAEGTLLFPMRPACSPSRSSRTISRPRIRYLGPHAAARCIDAQLPVAAEVTHLVVKFP